MARRRPHRARMGEARSSTPVRVDVSILKRPSLSKPVLICGLPDTGQVAKIVIDQLVRHVNAEPFADVYSFSFPARVVLKDDGTVELLKHRLYYEQAHNGVGDLILYTGDVQPESPEAAYAITDRVLELCISLGVKSIITVGAYITGTINQAPKVYATATTTALLKELEATQLPLIREGEITWMNGLILGLAKVRDVPAIFYAGETSGLPHLEDTRAAAAVLRVLDERMKLNLDPAKLQELANKTEDFLKSMEEFNERPSTSKRDSGYIR